MSPLKRRTRRALIALAASGLALVLLALVGYQVMNSRTFQVAGRLVDRVETTEKVVALTFDDGPTAADTDAILGVLAQRGVRATFYVNGGVAASNPGQLERLVAPRVPVDGLAGMLQQVRAGFVLQLVFMHISSPSVRLAGIVSFNNISYPPAQEKKRTD